MNYNIHAPDKKCVPIINSFAPDAQYKYSQQIKSKFTLN